MKNLKKILAVLLTLAMVLGMSITTFADGESTTPVTPTANDKQTATVTNVEDGATVTAYQIVKGDYNNNGFVQYVKADGEFTVADVLAPTSTEVTDIATAINNGTLTLTSKVMIQGQTATTDGLYSYTADLEAGYWIVLVDSNNVEEVYNPMLVGVYYSVSGSDNTMTSGSVDANTNWTLVTKDAYAKSTKPEVKKTIVDPGSQNVKGDDVGIGDTVKYQIATAIPSYSAEYKKVVVKISDTLSTGLTLDQNSIVVKSGETALVKDTEYTVTTTAQGFVVTIDSNYALAHGNAAITVTYSATLNENAGINFDPNTNTAELEYSNNPKNENDTEKKTDITYHYTFGIDAKLYGSSTSEWNKVTEEIWKTHKETSTEGGSTTTTKALEGAEFTLYTDADCTQVYKSKVATSAADGSLTFTGLDAGTYYLKETKAPSGYSINNAVIKVEISATYNENGTLKDYTIKMDDKYTNTYTATYASTTETSAIQEVTKIDHTTATGDAGDGASKPGQMPVLNTKISELPSTGGIGTTIFTVAGCIIMIVAAGLFFATRRKRA